MNKKILPFISLLALGTILLCFAAYPAWQNYRAAAALRQARKFVEFGDYRNASLSARRLILLSPTNIEACRLLAQLAEMSDPREALEWYQRIAQLAPTIENKLELTAKALRFQETPYELAARTLADLSGSASNRVTYCVLAAELALRLGKGLDAESWFEAARRLQPTNTLHDLNLGVLRLNSTNDAVASAARQTLHQFRTNSTFSSLALRSLITEAMNRKDLSVAENLSNELLTKANPSLEDQIRHLEILFQAGSPGRQRCLNSIQTGAITNAAETSALLIWMAQHGMAKDGIGWLTNASRKVAVNPSVRLAAAECFCVLRDWPAAETFLNEQKWGELEPMRLGLLSYVTGERREILAAELNWRLAIKQAQKRLGSLMWLAMKADEWGRDRSKEEVLWQIAEAFPNQRWASLELLSRARAGGSTGDLHRIYACMAKADPKDPGIQNNVAATGLLLRTDLDKSCETASELFAQYPLEPFIASTYAYSLHLRHRTADGLTALEQLSEECLTNPPIALYYGVLLRAGGQTNRAGRYLKLAESASLLPEERKLLDGR